MAPPTAASKLSAARCFSASAAVFGEQRLVGGDHRFARRERRLARLLGGTARAAHQFHEHIDAVRARKLNRIGEPFHFLQIDAALLGLGARANRNDLDAPAAARGKRLALLHDLGNQRRAHRAQTGDAYSEKVGHDRF
jgi:hypothetical protein